MTVWKVAVLYVIWAGLSLWYVAFERESPQEPAPAPRQFEPLVQVDPGEVTEITLRSHQNTLRAWRQGSRWSWEPAARGVTTDLVEALLSSFVETPVVQEVASGDAPLKEFGLDPPALTVSLARRSGQSTVIELGDRNAARTAVYARVRGKPGVALLGLNARYYADLLLEAARSPGTTG